MQIGSAKAMVLMAALAGCQSSPSAEVAPAVIGVFFDAPERCRITINQSNFELPESRDAVVTALKREAKIARNATIRADASIPYKCFGYAIVLAQGAGFANVGFTAEPPPPYAP